MTEPRRIASARELPGKHGRLVCEIRGVALHLSSQPSRSSAADTLLIAFHGAVDRATRPTPAFIPFLPGTGEEVHQVAIADPSLRTSSDISMGWYAGDCGFESQRVLPDFFQEISRALDVRRTIYFGTSGGGFAALFYSKQHDGSLALVGNPQTSIANYYPRHIANYLSSCWPGVSSISDLSGRVDTDLAAIYSGRATGNHVVYLQNSTDHFHLFGHMAPFLSSIRSGETRKRIACACVFPGRTGHNPVWEMFSPWLRAALVAPNWMAESIITTHHDLCGARTESLPLTARDRDNGAPGKARPVSELRMADLLRDYQLRQRMES